MRRAAVLAAALSLPLAPARALDRAALQPELAAAARREAPPYPAKRFETPQGVSGTLESRAAPSVEPGRASSRVTADVGAESPLTCEVHPDRVDAAATVAGMIRRLARTDGIRVVDSGVTAVEEGGGRPVLVTETAYVQAGPEGRPSLGLLKLAVALGDGASLVCWHDELGWSATFRRVVRSAAAELRNSNQPRDDDPREPAFRELQVIRLGSVPVGFVERLIARAEETLAVTTSAQLVPTETPGELRHDDASSVEVAGPDGVLRAADSVQSDETGLRKLELRRTGDGLGYAYEGELRGEPARGSFALPAGLASSVLLARTLAAKPPPAEARLQQWIPSSSAVGPTEVVIRRRERAGRFEVQTGGLTLTTDVDEGGVPVRSQGDPQPGLKLVSERVWSRGKL